MQLHNSALPYDNDQVFNTLLQVQFSVLDIKFSECSGILVLNSHKVKSFH